MAKASHLKKSGKLSTTQVLAVWFREHKVCGMKTKLGTQGLTRGHYVQLEVPFEARAIATNQGWKVMREDFPNIQRRAKMDVRLQVAKRAGEAVLNGNYGAVRKAVQLLWITGQEMARVDFNATLKNIASEEKLAMIYKSLGNSACR